MFMQDDFKHLRVTFNNKLQWFPPNSATTPKLRQNVDKADIGYLEYIKNVVKEYAVHSSMHGMNRIFESSSNRSKRITWTVVLFVCLLSLMCVSYRIAWGYHTKPLVTVVSSTHYDIFRIPFPEVTICNKNRLNWQRFEMAKRVFLQPEHQLIPRYQDIFLQIVNAYDTLSFGQFNLFKNLTKIPPAMLQELGYINFQFVAEFMAWKCHEIFTSCRWLDDEHNCCSIFFNRNSQMGPCLAFNTIESTDGLDKQRFDPLWPWRTKEPGIFNGLRVRIHLRERDHSPMQNNKKGILLMLAEPSVWSHSPIEVNTHTRTSISIDATLYTQSNYTRILSPRVRECLFQDEKNSRYYKSLPNRAYMVENCKSQCQLEYLLKYCNCTLSLYYPETIYRPCRAIDYPCLFYHNDKFKNFEESDENEYTYLRMSSGMKCKCFYNCNSLSYHTTITTAYMNHLKVNFNNSFINLNVFFQKGFIMVFMTTVQYTLSDLMAVFGGLAGLCVGCSLLSLVEIAYFLIIDMTHKTLQYFKMRKHLRWHHKSRVAKMRIADNFLRN